MKILRTAYASRRPVLGLGLQAGDLPLQQTRRGFEFVRCWLHELKDGYSRGDE